MTLTVNHRSCLAAFAFVAMLNPIDVVEAGPAYVITDIGSVDDLTDTVPTPPTSTALAISPNGIVGGSSAVSGGSFINGGAIIAEPFAVHAVEWIDGKLIDLGVLGGDVRPDIIPRPSSFITSINGLGQAVGEANLLEDALYHGFIHLPVPAYGLPAGISEIPPLAVQARAHAINDHGIVAGQTRETESSFESVAVIWTPADGGWSITNIGAMIESVSSIAYSVNNLDEVVGSFNTGLPENTTKAFLYLPEPAYGLPAGMSAGIADSIGSDINELGQVVGRGPGLSPMIWLPEPAYGLPAGTTFFPPPTMFDQAFLDEHGFQGVTYAEFTAINNDGIAVGNVQFTMELPFGTIVFALRGFVWRDGVFTLSEDLLAPGAGWQFIASSRDINDAGQLVGSGVTASGENRGYVMTPVASVAGDTDGDGEVDLADVLAVLASWGECPEPPLTCPADVDGSGVVAFGDLLIVLLNWT